MGQLPPAADVNLASISKLVRAIREDELAGIILPPQNAYHARVVSEHMIDAATGERWMIRTVEVRSGPDVSRHEVEDIAKLTVAEMDREVWDAEFERQTGIDPEEIE